jgi:chemotaxis methyl-accepting protein methylase
MVLKAVLLIVGIPMIFLAFRIAILAWRGKQMRDAMVEVLRRAIADQVIDIAEAQLLGISEMNKVDWSDLVFSLTIKKEAFFREEEFFSCLKRK